MEVIDLCSSSSDECESGDEDEKVKSSTSKPTVPSAQPALPSKKRQSEAKTPERYGSTSSSSVTRVDGYWGAGKFGSLFSGPEEANSSSLAAPAPAEPLVFLSDANDECIVTPGLVPLLLQQPKHEQVSNPTICWPQCTDATTMLHIQQKDKWSCGFRNLQMLLTAVLPLLPADHSFYSTHPRPSAELCFEIPSLHQFQCTMEASWREGYDPAAAKHYKHNVVGQRAWIGAVEVANLLTYMGIDATVVQFTHCAESRKLLAPFCRAYFSSNSTSSKSAAAASAVHLVDDDNDETNQDCSLAMVQHFLRVAASDATSTSGFAVQNGSTFSSSSSSRLPIYLQWAGHSVTIVGMERNHVLVFDPSKPGQILLQSLQKHQLKPLLLSCQLLETKDCQLVACSLQSLSIQKKEQLKHNLQVVTAAEQAVLKTLQQQGHSS